MKLTKLAVLVALILAAGLAVWSIDTYAQGAGSGSGTQARDGSCGTCPNYADANGDGVCDNKGTRGDCPNYVDADGDGVCDNKGACDGTQQRKRDGSGAGNGGQCQGKCKGQGGQGQGRCRG